MIYSIFVLLFLTIFTKVSAHSEIEETIPRFGETVEYSPEQIEIWFADPVEVYSESIKIIDQNGTIIRQGKPIVDPEQKERVIFTLEDPLQSGLYTIQVLAIAKDGHDINEQYQFEIINDTVSESEFWSNLKLEKSTPTDGEVVASSPTEITLTFTEIVELDIVGLYDDNQQMVPLGKMEVNENNPYQHKIHIDNELREGTYEVNWYVRKDNKSKNGIYYFAVGEVTSITPPQGKVNKVNWVGELDLIEVGNWLTYITVFVLFGVHFFQIIILKEKRPVIHWEKIKIWLYLLSILGLAFVFFARKNTIENISLIEFVSFEFVWGMVIQIILLLIAFIGRKKPTIELLILALTILVWAFSGHAVSERYGGWLSITMDALHMFGTAIWIGGITALIFLSPKLNKGEWFKENGKRFSFYALISIVVIIITGIGMVVTYTPSFTITSLMKSFWGNFLVLKILLLTGILLLGFFQLVHVRRKLKVRSFLSINVAEWVIGALVIFLAAGLVNATPRAAEQGITLTEQEIERDIDVTITPFELGYNDLIMKFEDSNDIDNVQVNMKMYPFFNRTIQAFEIGEGSYKVTGGLLHGVGKIDLVIVITKKDGNIEEVHYEIQVPGEMYNRED